MRGAAIAGVVAVTAAAVGLALAATDLPGLLGTDSDGAAPNVAGPAPLAHPDAAGRRITYPAARAPTVTAADGTRRTLYSVLNVPRRMTYGDYVWDDHGVPAGATWIRIDLANQMLSLFRGGHEIGTAVILYGTDHKPTPTGVFRILERSAQHRSTLYDAEMPFMLRLTNDGVAIHASNVRFGTATHGCIGVPEAFARRMFDQVRRGSIVTIERGIAAPRT